MTFISFNNDYIAFLPEIFFVISINFIIVYSVIYTTSPFFDYPLLITNVCWLALQVLCFVLYLIAQNPLNGIYIFNNLLIIDAFSNFVKCCLILGTVAVLLMCLKYNKFEFINGFEFIVLILLTVVGALLLTSSYDLISMYLAIELQSFCSYIIASFKRNSEFSAEAGLKYFILGAFSSGFLLFGCALVYGFTGTTNYEQLSMLFFGTYSSNMSFNGVLVGVTFILISILFKLSAAPFHIWSPDIYEGSPTIVTAFFAIVPKIGLFALAVRLFFHALYGLFIPWQEFIIFASISSMCIGSFGAIWQIKLKRLLAFSAISHVGYMLIGLCCSSTESIYALFFYSIVYIIMSICSFSLLLMVRKNHDLKKIKYIEDLTVIAKTNPLIGLGFCITFFLLQVYRR